MYWEHQETTQANLWDDLGLMNYFLGMQVWQLEGRYALDILKKFDGWL